MEKEMSIACPLCSSQTLYATKEEHIQEVAYHATVHAWGCQVCYWVDLISVEEGQTVEGPVRPRDAGYGGEFRQELSDFIESCDVEPLPKEAIKELPKWAVRLKTVLGEERRVRRMVGLSKHKPVSPLELQFQTLLQRARS